MPSKQSEKSQNDVNTKKSIVLKTWAESLKHQQNSRQTDKSFHSQSYQVKYDFHGFWFMIAETYSLDFFPLVINAYLVDGGNYFTIKVCHVPSVSWNLRNLLSSTLARRGRTTLSSAVFAMIKWKSISCWRHKFHFFLYHVLAHNPTWTESILLLHIPRERASLSPILSSPTLARCDVCWKKQKTPSYKAQKKSHISSRSVPYIILNDFERDLNLLNYLIGYMLWGKL